MPGWPLRSSQVTPPDPIVIAPWVLRVEGLDLDEVTKGNAIAMIFGMPLDDREGFVSRTAGIAKAAILRRLGGE